MHQAKFAVLRFVHGACEEVTSVENEGLLASRLAPVLLRCLAWGCERQRSLACCQMSYQCRDHLQEYQVRWDLLT